MQSTATHVPWPSQSVPPPSAQAVPWAAFVTLHVCVVASHASILQSVVCAGQSLAARQATHTPIPSHTRPPLSVHAAPAGAFVVPQQPMLHVGTTQALVSPGQSFVAAQAIPASQALGMPPAPPLELVPVVVVPVLEEVVAPPVPPAPPGPEPQLAAALMNASIMARQTIPTSAVLIMFVLLEGDDVPHALRTTPGVE